jgi:hypothetical protein
MTMVYEITVESDVVSFIQSQIKRYEGDRCNGCDFLSSTLSINAFSPNILQCIILALIFTEFLSEIV